MSESTPLLSEQLNEALSRELDGLAQREDEIAAQEAEHVHYWEAMPVTVTVHHQCANALRAAARELDSGRRAQPRPAPEEVAVGLSGKDANDSGAE